MPRCAGTGGQTAVVSCVAYFIQQGTNRNKMAHDDIGWTGWERMCGIVGGQVGKWDRYEVGIKPAAASGARAMTRQGERAACSERRRHAWMWVSDFALCVHLWGEKKEDEKNQKTKSYSVEKEARKG